MLTTEAEAFAAAARKPPSGAVATALPFGADADVSGVRRLAHHHDIGAGQRHGLGPNAFQAINRPVRHRDHLRDEQPQPPDRDGRLLFTMWFPPINSCLPGCAPSVRRH